MPAQNLAVPLNEFAAKSDRHRQVITGVGEIEARLQKLVAELLMLRLFDDFQDAIAGIALRLACGTPYLDGTVPVLLSEPARSTSGARRLFEAHGRRREARLRWSKTPFINDTTRFVLGSSNTFNAACSANSLAISEMQAIRNRIAHANTKSRAAFARVVKQRYGASLNHVTPGVLLMSKQFSPPLLEQYLASCRATVKGCARA